MNHSKKLVSYFLSKKSSFDQKTLNLLEEMDIQEIPSERLVVTAIRIEDYIFFVTLIEKYSCDVTFKSYLEAINSSPEIFYYVHNRVYSSLLIEELFLSCAEMYKRGNCNFLEIVFKDLEKERDELMNYFSGNHSRWINFITKECPPFIVFVYKEAAKRVIV